MKKTEEKTVAFKELGDQFIEFFSSHIQELSLFIDASNYANNKSLEELLVEFIVHMERPLDHAEYIDAMQKYINDMFDDIRETHSERFIQSGEISKYLDEKMRIHKKRVLHQQLERFNLSESYVVEFLQKELSAISSTSYV